ncbi:MAG: bifunctional glutamate N-acetyltransferase/amino-acid acetyltransferase ArgJ [Spirochaetaceae bacterium]|jgi:glutamate N-acetyltransferase/amino-acid N-acetyltransferase|nr:bifunctional glutamate N-acetyltransferase/amino-acid acetyltransferase ArgJ [Spirochaetaceae bacterium]
MREISGGVCAPRGFRAGGIRCGIKASSRKRDLALIVSDRPCAAAGVFTTNRVQAASVIVSREHIAAGTLRAVIANSGNANACTGEEGLQAARRMAALTAERLSVPGGAVPAGQVAVASTGVIGVPLPAGAIERGIAGLFAALESSAEGHDAALEAIMTTDTRKKGGAAEIEIGGAAVRIGGMVKGSGMIHPNMATMLGFITTDADISRGMLDRALRRAVRRSFNRITVDGDSSTNDTVLVLANGEARNPPVETDGAGYEAFASALESFCAGLARAMARDGEGASRLMTVTVRGAAGEDDAEILAKSVASSSLVKAACHGADANWGRVLCALGYAGVPFDPGAVSVRFASPAGTVLVCEKGGPAAFSEEDAARVLSQEEVEILVDIGGGGGGAASVWGCDLTCDYVRINGDYRS